MVLTHVACLVQIQSREEYIEDIEKLPMMKVFIPSLVEKLQHEQGKYR